MHQYQPQQAHEDQSNTLRADKTSPNISGVGSATATQRSILQLQRTHGNQFVRRQLVQRGLDDYLGGLGGTGGGGGASSASQSISGPGGSVDVSGSGVDINTSGTVTINGSKIENNASTINNETSLMDTSGVDKSNTVITDTVVAQVYTPGAGNIW